MQATETNPEALEVDSISRHDICKCQTSIPVSEEQRPITSKSTAELLSFPYCNSMVTPQLNFFLVLVPFYNCLQ
jgi:hypothetical protein